MGKLLDWLDHRTGYRKLRDALLLEHIPGGARWRYVWGSTLAFVFMLQLVTGILLMTSYAPSDTDAWRSVHFIQYQMDFGWLIRGLHHFGSQTMVVLIGVHMLQVVIAGAHLPPREVNWWLGLALMGLVLGLSLTGYLLPWDQKGYYATQVATNIMGNLPVIGPFIQKVLLGGPEYGNLTLTHFFALHVGVLPPLVILFIILHLAAFRRHGVTAPKVELDSDGKPVHGTPPVIRAVIDLILGGTLAAAVWYFGVPIITCGLILGVFVMFASSRFLDKPKQLGHFWPDQAFRDLLVCLFIFAIMLSLVVFSDHGHKIEPPAGAEEPGLYEKWAKAGQEGRGANLDAPADPITESYEARPEWYFLFLFELLKFFPGDQEIIGTVVIPGAVGGLLFLLPLLGYGRMRRFGHIFGIVVVVGLLVGASALTIMAIGDDSAEPMLFGLMGGSKKAKAYHEGHEKSNEEARLAVQAAMSGGPAEGSRYLVRSNPLIAGKKLFKTNCATCHAYTFKDGEEEAKDGKAPAHTASDLTGFGTQAWVRGLLENPGGKKYFGSHDPKDPSAAFRKTMIEWREEIDEERKTMEPEKKKEQDHAFDEIAWWVAEQGRVPPDERLDFLQKDAAYRDRWKKGVELATDRCFSCHGVTTHVHESKDGKSEIWVEKRLGGGPGPDFTRYGSADWVHTMVLAPTHRSRYADLKKKGGKEFVERNAMPAFRPPADTPSGKLSLEEFTSLYGNFAENKIFPLTDYERELIVRFLKGDDRIVFGALPIAGPPRLEAPKK